MNPIHDTVHWAFRQNYHLDKSNAAVHCAPVRFSPLTFRLYETLVEVWPTHFIAHTDEMNEVRRHIGEYALDGGR